MPCHRRSFGKHLPLIAARRADREEVGVVRVRIRERWRRRGSRELAGSEKDTKSIEDSERGRVMREMDGLGARQALTVVPADVTQPRQGG